MAERTPEQLQAWAHAMTLRTLGGYVGSIAEDIRSVSKAEREAVLNEARGRLMFMDLLLNGEKAGVLEGMLRTFTEDEMRAMVQGGVVGDFSDIEASMNALEAEMNDGGEC